MAAKLLIIEGFNPLNDAMVTVTVSGVKSVDRARVIKVLANLFALGSEEWEGPAPNVRLVAEHTGDLAEA